MSRLLPAGVMIVFGVGLSISGGCTLGDLGSYEISKCDPSIATLAQDPCNRLNKEGGCEIYQCDRDLHRCLLSKRDFDRDGDPAPECGGHDCDDQDAARSSLQKEVCDGKDNNCDEDEVVDEGVLTPGESTQIVQTGALPSHADIRVASDGEGLVMASYVAKTKGGDCVQAARLLGPNPGVLFAECSFLADTPTLVPRQPQVHTYKGGVGAVFIETSACPVGRMAYRYVGSGNSVPHDWPCETGAALPSWAFGPSGTTALVTWYEVSVQDRTRPFDVCKDMMSPQAAPAPLVMSLLSDVGSDSVTVGETQTLTQISTSTGPAAVEPVEALGGFLVAAPSDPDVSLWFIHEDGTLGTTAQLPLPEARAVALSVHMADGEPMADSEPPMRLAVVAEIKCAPQSIQLLVARGTGPAALEYSDPIEVVGEHENVVATQPAVSWIASRKEWMVTWITNEGPALLAQRFTPEGVPIDGVLRVAENIQAGAVASESVVVGFDAVESSFNQIPMVCP